MGNTTGAVWERLENEVERLPDPCPFCNGTGRLQQRWVTLQGERSGPSGGYSKRLYHFYRCKSCGAQGGGGDNEEEALLGWNRRTVQHYYPLPDTGASVLLPGGQKYGHLLVMERGVVRLIDYIEPECTTDGSGIAGQVEVNLGQFRVCAVRRDEGLHGQG